jgi:hypothetical protein
VTSSSTTVAEGSSPSQDKSVDFLHKYTKLVVIQARLLHQVLLGQIQYLQAGPDYRHGRCSKDTGNIHQPSFGGRFLLLLCACCSSSGSSSRRSTLLRSRGYYFLSGSSRRLYASLRSRGLALQLRYELLDSGGWTTTSSRLSHRVPFAFVALLDGLCWWHLLHTRKTTHQQVYSLDGYSTTLVKASYLLGRGLRDLHLLRHPLAGGVARLSWRRSQASLQASRLVLHKRHMR